MTEPDKSSSPLVRLTTSEFWDSCYEGRNPLPFDDRNWRNYVSIQLARLIESLQLDGKTVCEVGGGDAELTAFFAKRHHSARFSVVDFSPLGCELARRRASREGVDLNVCQADIFAPPTALLDYFDLVISLGVVEHFSDLSSVMMAKSRLIHGNGKIFTLIPNFSSPVYAGLCKRWSKTVFEDHVPHNTRSFLDGHYRAGLKPIDYGYLGAIEFGMLSMAMHGPEPKTGLDRQFYLWLTRLSKLIHFLERKTRDLPTTKYFSPFIYAVSEKRV
jgi:2-polyprenyl-3-methyl-5-hydroxy-6-metoxy-1,4-benzoquinol methylase